jgi:hypothetical protein
MNNSLEFSHIQSRELNNLILYSTSEDSINNIVLGLTYSLFRHRLPTFPDVQYPTPSRGSFLAHFDLLFRQSQNVSISPYNIHITSLPRKNYKRKKKEQKRENKIQKKEVGTPNNNLVGRATKEMFWADPLTPPSPVYL